MNPVPLVSDTPRAGVAAGRDLKRAAKIGLVSGAKILAGGQIAAERLALGLQAAGHEVFMVLDSMGPAFEHMRGAGLRCLHAPNYTTDKWHWWRYRRARNNLRDLLAREQPDLVHSNDLVTHQMVSDAVRGLGIPEICHHRFFFPSPAIDWLNKYGAAHHLFVSRALMEDMCANSQRLRASPRSVVYDGLLMPPDPTPEVRQDARQRLGLSPDRVVVTFAGQIIEIKGVADLLRAWALLPESLASRADLLILGDDQTPGGKYRLAMEQLARELHSPARFLGFRKDVGTWLCASDAAVVPSHVEPLGNATLEAMSFGLPVVGCAVGGIPEMVVHEQTGLLVPPKSPERLAGALSELLSDETTRQRYGRAARKRCEDMFTLEVHTRSVLEEYQRFFEPI